MKTLEDQQTNLVLQALLNGQPVQSISDVAGDVVVLPFVQYQSSRCVQHTREHEGADGDLLQLIVDMMQHKEVSK